MQTPVSVGDLPSYKYCVSTRTITEEVTSYLETHPEIPGVILLQDDIFHSAIPRTSMFERLGHRYGIELFLRKPIIELQQNLQVKALAISSNLRIKEAVENALQRDVDSMYAPLVVSHNDGETRLLDMYTLLTAQSHILDNANSILGRMNTIEDALQAKLPYDKLFDMVMDSMMSVVPYHRAGLFVSPSRWMKLSFTHPLVHRMSDKMRETSLFRTISGLHQPIVVEDIQAHPYRHALASLGSVRAWIGLPLQTIFGVEGVLSLSRFSLTAFTREEIELAKSFIDYFGLVLNEPSDHQPRSISLEKTRRRLSLLAGV